MEGGRHDEGPLGWSAALFPALVLLVFALWCGTFAGGASARGAMAAHGILWLAWVWYGSSIGGWTWRGVTSLGLVWIAVALPWALSPVPRAGSTVVALLPTYLILPWLVARCWRDQGRARWGVVSVAVTLAVVSGRGLWGWLKLGTDGASLPLGHHNLLAAFLVTLLPLAAVGWRFPGALRWFSISSVGLGVVALWATRSLAGGAALGAAVVFWFACDRRARRVGGWRPLAAYGAVSLGVLTTLLLVFGRRLGAMAAGLDSSSRARSGYWTAGWSGFLERPWFGWGPGSTPWTVQAFFQPVPGVHPPDAVLADLHCLPLQLIYELGLVGCILLAVAVWIAPGIRRQASESALKWAGWAGLVGFGVVSLGGMPLSVTALPLAAAVAAGAMLTGREQPPTRRGTGPVVRLAMVLLVGAISAWIIVPRDLAQLAWQRAAAATTSSDQIEELQRADELDPDFPLYSWRLALALDDQQVAQQAAEQARSVAVLWLTAGHWDRACRLSPFGVMAPFHAGSQRGEVAARSRALAAQPWLLASVDWLDQTEDTSQAVGRLVADSRIEPGWRTELDAIWQLMQQMPPESASIRRLVLDVDGEPATSLSLFTFRRTPWPVRVDQIRLDARRLGLVVEMPSAALLPTTDPTLFHSPSCDLGAGAQNEKRTP